MSENRIGLRIKPKEGGGFTAVFQIDEPTKQPTMLSIGHDADPRTAAKWALHHAFRAANECARILVELGVVSEDEADWIAQDGMNPNIHDEDEPPVTKAT